MIKNLVANCMVNVIKQKAVKRLNNDKEVINIDDFNMNIITKNDSLNEIVVKSLISTLTPGVLITIMDYVLKDNNMSNFINNIKSNYATQVKNDEIVDKFNYLFYEALNSKENK